MHLFLKQNIKDCYARKWLIKKELVSILRCKQNHNHAACILATA